jgi:hypothetical protein
MKITLIGAAEGEVTGSCYSVQTKRAVFSSIVVSFKLLTQAHLDHTGRLPLLAKMSDLDGCRAYAWPSIDENGKTKRVMLSGDLGARAAPRCSGISSRFSMPTFFSRINLWRRRSSFV